jgi:ubiquinone/menaquinone biosynthesis C-methylase UbiE
MAPTETPTIDVDEIIGRGLEYQGVTFASRPAALRQLLLLREIVANIEPGPGVIGIDVGSKYGDLSTMLAAHEIRCVRVDIEDRPSQGEFVLADGEALPLRDGSVDFVVLSHVMAHAPKIQAFMGEMARVLKPGAKIFILQSNRFGWWKFWGYYIRRNDRIYHWRTFDMWSLRRTLADQGLRIDSMFAPYYFYLHSKVSRVFYWLDRRLEHRVPNAVSTQWLVMAHKALQGEDVCSGGLTPPPFARVVLTGFATMQALFVKAMELALVRVLRRGSVGEQT